MDEKTPVAETALDVQKTETAVAAAPATSMNWLDNKTMAAAWKTASMLSSSGLLPQTYQKHPENVLIALDLASRMDMSLMTVCQNLYIVQGKPAWSGQFCIAAVNASGKYSPLEFLWLEDGGCIAQATDLRTGKVCQSAPVTPDTVKAFGWDKKAGSMWNIPGMDKQMYMYRAAAFFARTFCPDVLNGVYTAEEVRDMTSWQGVKKEDYVTMEDNNG